ncbi:MAG: hypothetical protein Q8R36_00545 [bacterium]|nr:hypothetical protein [bacterium]
MEVAMLFASLPGKDGEALSARAKKYCRKTARFLKDDPHRCVLFASDALGFRQSELYSKLITQELRNLGVQMGQIVVLSSIAESTLGEIELAEAYYVEHTPRDITMYAISSWQHLPRILFLWKLHYGGRIVKPVWVWDFYFETLFLLALEPFKFFLSILPSSIQGWFNIILFKLIYK